MRRADDTIAAIATPAGRGGVGIVRVSGPAAIGIARALTGADPVPRCVTVRDFLDARGHALDRGIVLSFRAPGSYTGEDVAEFHGHGGPVVLDAVLARVLALGARPAGPGEFTERAFLNDRLDLAQAEAVADLIDAGTEAAARAAMRSLEGALSAAVGALAERFIDLRAWIEAAIDFPEEEVDFLADDALARRLQALRGALGELRGRIHHGVLLGEGMSLVIAGRPNVGKSSLLNRLVGRDAAIVTEIPGTTRDPVRERVPINGVAVELLDTAGLRPTSDPVEQIGVERAWTALAGADAVLLVCDDAVGPGEWEHEVLERAPAGLPTVLVRNKIDRTGSAPGVEQWAGRASVRVSVARDEGIGLLESALGALVVTAPVGAGEFSARRRHLDALERAARHLEVAADRLRDGDGELAAEELRTGHEALTEITGAFTSDDLLGRIFATFCIGK